MLVHSSMIVQPLKSYAYITTLLEFLMNCVLMCKLLSFDECFNMWSVAINSENIGKISLSQTIQHINTRIRTRFTTLYIFNGWLSIDSWHSAIVAVAVVVNKHFAEWLNGFTVDVKFATGKRERSNKKTSQINSYTRTIITTHGARNEKKESLLIWFLFFILMHSVFNRCLNCIELLYCGALFWYELKKASFLDQKSCNY